MFFVPPDAGSYNQETPRANRADFEQLKLRQRILVINMDKRSTATTILGETGAGAARARPDRARRHDAWRRRDPGLAAPRRQPASCTRCRPCRSTRSRTVAYAVDKPFWFQLYVMRDRGFIRELIQERSRAAKCSALMLTVDPQVLGQRHCDVRNGLTVPPEIKIKNVIDIMTKPPWALSILASCNARPSRQPRRRGVKGMENVTLLAQWTASQFDSTLNWKDVEWVKSPWPGKLILKGILDVDDAKIAVTIGADAISVSNHGGRQLDGAPSAISALLRIVDTVGSEVEVMMDSGVYRLRHDAGAGAGRPLVHCRAVVHIWAGRRRSGRWRRARHRDPGEGIRYYSWRCAARRALPRSAAMCWLKPKHSGGCNEDSRPDHPITITPVERTRARDVQRQGRCR